MTAGDLRPIGARHAGRAADRSGRGRSRRLHRGAERAGDGSGAGARSRTRPPRKGAKHRDMETRSFLGRSARVHSYPMRLHASCLHVSPFSTSYAGSSLAKLASSFFVPTLRKRTVTL
jgi:hypothetical protein